MRSTATAYRRLGMVASTIMAISVMMLALGVGSAPVTPTSDIGIEDNYPKPVRGNVTDMFGYPIEGANVTVVVKVGATVRATMWYDSTEPNGYYAVTFEGSQWDVGNTIEVTARYGAEIAQNSTIADSSAVQNIDVRFSFAIPEFGSMFPLTVIGCVSVFVLLRWRRS